MGNRAVITTRENFEKNGVGIYLHWNGGRDSVNAFLSYCKARGFASPEKDFYGWARLCQVIGNFFGGGGAIGIDTVNLLDCDNHDNGVYLIENWEIIGREYHKGPEQDEYGLTEMMISIDECQPEAEQLGADFFTASEIDVDLLEIGDEVLFTDWKGKAEKGKIIGFGETGKVVNGKDVTGLPYLDRFRNGEPERNINNYLKDARYKVVGAKPEELKARIEKKKQELTDEYIEKFTQIALQF